MEMERSEELSDAKYRMLSKPWALSSKVILVTIPIWGILYIMQLHIYLHIYILNVQFLAVLLSLSLAAVFLLFPEGKNAPHQRVPWYDIGLILLSLAFGAYAFVNWPNILANPRMTPSGVGLGCGAALVLLEATRRVLGWALVFFALGAIALALWGNLVQLHLINYSWQRWFYFFYLDESGIYGDILNIIGSIVFAFIVFGRLLVSTGAGKNLTDLTTALVGRYTGGIGKAAVVASCAMGTIAGSIAVNAVTIGTVTIPLMKKAGYRPAFAAGVESAASTGGVLLPPVMGVTAFLIAQFMGIPFYQVAIAALLPAILYYWGVFLQVDLEARKMGIQGVPVELLPQKKKALINSLPVLIPLGVIVYSLFILRLAPGRVGLYGATSVALTGLFFKSARARLIYFHRILEDAGRSFLELSVVGGIAGLIVSPLILSGLGTGLAAGLREMAGGQLLPLLFMAAIANLILGLGLPAVVTYVLMAVMVVPAMVQAGVAPLAAHLFTLYFAVAAELTPPAGVPIFITMVIARASFLSTALVAMRLASSIFILPFVLVFRQGLMAEGTVWVILSHFFLTAAGISALAISFEGYLGRRIALWQRPLLALSGVALFVPQWEANVVGGIVILMLSAFWLKGRTAPRWLLGWRSR